MRMLSHFYPMLIVVVFILISCSTYLGGLLALRLQDKRGLVMAFSAGIVTGVFFFDLLPKTFSMHTGHFSYAGLTSFIASGFVAYMLLDRLGSGMAAAGLSLHGLFDGLAVGMAFTMNGPAGFVSLPARSGILLLFSDYDIHQAASCHASLACFLATGSFMANHLL